MSASMLVDIIVGVVESVLAIAVRSGVNAADIKAALDGALASIVQINAAEIVQVERERKIAKGLIP